MSLVSLNIRSRIELETRVLAAALKQSFERGDTDGVTLAHQQLFILLKDAGKPVPEENSPNIVVADSEQMQVASGGVVKVGSAAPAVAPASPLASPAQARPEPVGEAPRESGPDGESTATSAESAGSDAAVDDPTVASSAESGQPSVSGAGPLPAETPLRDLKVTQDLSTALRNYQPTAKTKRDLVQEMRRFAETTAAHEANAEAPATPATGKPDEPKFKQGFMRHAARVQQAAARIAAKVKPGEPPPNAEPAGAEPLQEEVSAEPVEAPSGESIEAIAVETSSESAADTQSATPVDLESANLSEHSGDEEPADDQRDESQADTLRLRRQRDAVTGEMTAEQQGTLSENRASHEASAVDPAPVAAPARVEGQEPAAVAERQLPGSAHIELVTQTEFEIVSPETAGQSEQNREPVQPSPSFEEASESPPLESTAGESAAPVIEPSPATQEPPPEPATTGDWPTTESADQANEPSDAAPDTVPTEAAVATDEAAAPPAEPEASTAEPVTSVPEAPAPPPRPNIYALLDVSPMSPFEEIHRRFMRKARQVLLTIKKNKAIRHQKLAELQKLWIAHDILTDPVTRTDYDFRDLGVRGAPDSVAHPADDPQGRMAARTPLRIGELLQCAGLLEASELEIACDMHKAVPDLQFGTFLVRQGFIQDRDLESALVGQKLLRVGAITVAQFQVAMDLAQSRGSLIDETLIEKGYISKDDLEERLNPPVEEAVAPPVVQIREIQVNQRGGDIWKEQTDRSPEPEGGTPRQSLGGFLSSQQSAAESTRRQPNYHLDLSSPEAEEGLIGIQKKSMNYELDFTSPPPEQMAPAEDPAPQESTAQPATDQRTELRLSNAVPHWKDQIDWTASEGEEAAQEAQSEPESPKVDPVTTGDFSTPPVSSTGDFDVLPVEPAQALEAAQAQAAQSAGERPAIDVNNDMITAITADGSRFEMLSTRPAASSAETQPIFLKQSEPGFDPGLAPALDSQQQEYWAQNDPGFDQHETQAPAVPPAPEQTGGSETRSASQMETLEFMPPQLPTLVINSSDEAHSTTQDEAAEGESEPESESDQSSASVVPSNTVSAPPAAAADSAAQEYPESGFFSHLIGATDIFESSALPLAGDTDSNGQSEETEKDLDDEDDPASESSQSKGIDRRRRRDGKRRRRK